MGNVVGGSAVGAAEHSVTVTQMSIDHIGENVASWDVLFFCQVLSPFNTYDWTEGFFNPNDLRFCSLFALEL